MRTFDKPTKYTNSRTVVRYIWIHSTLAVSEWKTVVTMFHKLLVRCSSFLFLPSLFFSSDLAISYHSDHRPRIIGNEKVPHSQSHAVTNGMWALAPSAIKYAEYVLPPLGPQNATGPPTAPTSLAALDARTSRTKPRESEFPTCSDIGNDCFYSSNRSPPLPNSSFAVPHTGRILHVHISLSVDYVTFFSWVGLAAVFCLVLFCLGFSKEYS